MSSRSVKQNLREINSMASSIEASLERFIDNQKEKEGLATDFLTFFSKSEHELIEDKVKLIEAIQKGIKAIDIANNVEFTATTTRFIEYLSMIKPNMELVLYYKIEILNTFLMEYAIDRKKYGTELFEQSTEFTRWIGSIVKFLKSYKREYSKLKEPEEDIL